MYKALYKLSIKRKESKYWLKYKIIRKEKESIFILSI